MDELLDGVVLLDPENRYIHWTRAYAEIYTRSADLFAVGVRMVDTLRVGVARRDYPEALGRVTRSYLADWKSPVFLNLARVS